MLQDIKDKDDIITLVDTFYNKVKTNETLGYIFNDIMQVNWDIHLPKMYNFWDNLLFQTGNYTDAPFPAHIAVNQKKQLGNTEFNQCILLFTETVNELFKGPKADELKQKAQSIQVIWNTKFNHINNNSNG